MHSRDYVTLPRERSTPGADIESLVQINADAVLDALGLSGLERGGGLLRRVIRPHTVPFARLVAGYDALVGQGGLAAGAEWLLERFIGRLDISGQHHVPADGPALILSNHPGLSDTLALFASIPRQDLRILAADKPFLRALPQTSERLIYLADRPQQRLSALRGIASHLRSGGAMLTFPAGRIEPDPALRSADAAKLEGWQDPLRTLMRIAHEVPVVPAVVRGVLSPAAQRNPITWLRRERYDREWLGSVLQTMWRPYQQVNVQVLFGPPVVGVDCVGQSFVGRLLEAERTLMTLAWSADMQSAQPPKGRCAETVTPGGWGNR